MSLSLLPLHPVYLQGEPHTQGAYSLSLLSVQVCGTDGNGYRLTAESLGAVTPTHNASVEWHKPVTP